MRGVALYFLNNNQSPIWSRPTLIYSLSLSLSSFATNGLSSLLRRVIAPAIQDERVREEAGPRSILRSAAVELSLLFTPLIIHSFLVLYYTHIFLGTCVCVCNERDRADRAPGNRVALSSLMNIQFGFTAFGHCRGTCARVYARFVTLL